MRNLILVLLTLAAIPVRAATNAIENGSIRLEVSPQTGSIIHLVDKQTHTDYIKDPTKATLFRFALPRPDYTARHSYEFGALEINSSDQQVDSVTAQGGILTVHYRKLQVSPPTYGYMITGPGRVPEPPREIEVAVSFRLDGEHILCSLQLDNHGREEISEVSFPRLGGLLTSREGQRARVIIPSLSQKSISATFSLLGLGGESTKPYPSLLATSWLNYEFQDQGIGIEIQAPPETESASFSLAPSGGFIAWNLYPHVAGQSRWTSPDIILHVHASDWHRIAGEHRAWYGEQNKPHRVEAFDNEIGFATYRLKREDNTLNWTYDQIPKLAEQAKSAGIHRLIIEGWREREGPGNPCPFGEIADPRMGGGARLKTLIKTLDQQGVDLAFAFHPTLINTATEQYESLAPRWTVKSRVQGNQLSTSYIFISHDYPYEDYGAHYRAQLDPASPATDYLLQQAKRLRDEYGFQGLFLRGVGLPSFLSYNQNSAVAPQRTYAVGYARLLGGLRNLFPNGLLLMEGFNDLINPYATAGYTWSQSDGAEVLSYSMPWLPFSNDVEALEYAQANASFARKILINLIVDGGDGTVERYPDFAGHLRALQALKKATGPYYAEADFQDREGLKSTVADSSVMVAVFKNPSTRQGGVVIANLSDQKKTVPLELGVDLAHARGRIFRLGGQQERLVSGSQISVDLQAREVVVLGLDPNP